MMQKVQVRISASSGFTGLFHFSFSVPLRYFLCCSVVPFLSPILGGKNDLFGSMRVRWGLIDEDVLIFVGGGAS